MAPSYKVKLRAMTAEAANYHKVPFWVVWGTMGNETAFGHDDKTSSAAAKGILQFIHSTAEAHGYPWTNAQDLLTVIAQLLGGAQLLGELWNQTHDAQQVEEAFIGGHVGSGAHYPVTIQAMSKHSSAPELEWNSPARQPVSAFLRGTGAIKGALSTTAAAVTTLGAAVTNDHQKDPPDYSAKVHNTGRHMSESGNSLRGHAHRVRQIAQREAGARLPRLARIQFHNRPSTPRRPSKEIMPTKLPRYKQVKI